MTCALLSRLLRRKWRGGEESEDKSNRCPVQRKRKRKKKAVWSEGVKGSKLDLIGQTSAALVHATALTQGRLSLSDSSYSTATAQLQQRLGLRSCTILER